MGSVDPRRRLPLLVAYTLAMVVAIGASLRAAFVRPLGREGGGGAARRLRVRCGRAREHVQLLPFIGQSGLDFWLLNACVWVACDTAPKQEIR